MVFCQERGLHFLVDEVYALSDFGRKGGDDCAAGADALAFMSTLALVGPSSSDAAVGSGNSIMDPSRLHVVWSMSKDFGSSGMRMVRENQHISLPTLLLELDPLELGPDTFLRGP